MAKINYLNEKVIDENNLSLNLLEISQKHGIRHASSCGGTAHCTTCRVKIIDGIDNTEPRNSKELITSRLKGFPDEIRLACQTKITGPVTIERLVKDDRNIRKAMFESVDYLGRQTNIAVLFCDIRNFTSFVESNMPFDVVHILNRYFLAMGNAVHHHNGKIDKYIGDEIMALFGLNETDPVTICTQAVFSALQMLYNLKLLNKYYKKNFNVEFEIGIGIEYGDVLVGEMGHPDAIQFSAIGDVVNIAKRIESATKQSEDSIMISESVYKHVKDIIKKNKTIEIELKGKNCKNTLIEIPYQVPLNMSKHDFFTGNGGYC